jgi:hypothetical protein
MVAQAELQVLAVQPVVRLALPGPTALSAMEAMPATEEPVARALTERLESLE